MPRVNASIGKLTGKLANKDGNMKADKSGSKSRFERGPGTRGGSVTGQRRTAGNKDAEGGHSVDLKGELSAK